MKNIFIFISLFTISCGGSTTHTSEVSQSKSEPNKIIAKIDTFKGFEHLESKTQKLNLDTLKYFKSKFRVKKDDMNGVTWYRDKSSPISADGNGLFFYLGVFDDNTMVLRSRIQYKAEDWLFIESFKIKTDKGTYDIEADDKMERDNYNSIIWEWYDQPSTKRDINIFIEVSDSKSCKIRYNGSKYYSDRIISSKEKLAIKNMLSLFYALGGTNESVNKIY